MSYPLKFREKALEAVRNGYSKVEVSKMLGIGINTLKAWENLEAETNSLENRPLNRIAYKIDREKLLEYYKNNPYSTNKETAEAFNCSVSGIRDAKKVLGITRKKTICYGERNEEKRKEFIKEIENLDEDSELFYIDESGFEEYYAREYGYAPRGEKVIGNIMGRQFARTNIIAAINGSKIIAPFAFSGSTNSDLFEGCLESILIPEIEDHTKSVLILDNASFHRKNAIYDITNEYGIKVIFLPPYSPDYNPIEKFWANVKRRLRLL